MTRSNPRNRTCESVAFISAVNETAPQESDDSTNRAGSHGVCHNATAGIADKNSPVYNATPNPDKTPATEMRRSTMGFAPAAPQRHMKPETRHKAVAITINHDPMLR